MIQAIVITLVYAATNYNSSILRLELLRKGVGARLLKLSQWLNLTSVAFFFVTSYVYYISLRLYTYSSWSSAWNCGNIALIRVCKTSINLSSLKSCSSTRTARSSDGAFKLLPRRVVYIACVT